MARLRNPMSGRPYPKSYWDVDTTHDMLLLACADPVDVGKWTAAQREEAGNWAIRTCLKASDNAFVRVPKVPDFVKMLPIEWFDEVHF